MAKYTIGKGDSLGMLAKRFNTSVSSLASNNNIKDINKIRIGDTINVGNSNSYEMGDAAQKSRSYKIKQGDNLSSIAKNNNISLDELIKHNNIRNPNLINIGQELKIPATQKPINRE